MNGYVLVEGLPQDWSEQIVRAYSVMNVEPPGVGDAAVFGWREWLHPRSSVGQFRRKPRTKISGKEMRKAIPNIAKIISAKEIQRERRALLGKKTPVEKVLWDERNQGWLGIGSRIEKNKEFLTREYGEIAKGIDNLEALELDDVDRLLERAHNLRSREDVFGEQMLDRAIDMLVNRRRTFTLPPDVAHEPLGRGPLPEQSVPIMDALDREFPPHEAAALQSIMLSIPSMDQKELKNTADMLERKYKLDIRKRLLRERGKFEEPISILNPPTDSDYETWDLGRGYFPTIQETLRGTPGSSSRIFHPIQDFQERDALLMAIRNAVADEYQMQHFLNMSPVAQQDALFNGDPVANEALRRGWKVPTADQIRAVHGKPIRHKPNVPTLPVKMPKSA